MKKLQVAYDDHERYLNRRLRIKCAGSTNEGVMIGIDRNTYMPTGVHPWILQQDGGAKCPFIPGLWEIFDVAASKVAASKMA